MSAKTAIWIMADPRPEHVSAITWLNESSSANFYLLKLEAIRIGDSPPAPLLTVIVGPSEEEKRLERLNKKLQNVISSGNTFGQLLDLAKKRTKLHANISPAQHEWLGTSAETGALFQLCIEKTKLKLSYISIVVKRRKKRIKRYSIRFLTIRMRLRKLWRTT